MIDDDLLRDSGRCPSGTGPVWPLRGRPVCVKSLVPGRAWARTGRKA